MALNHVQEQEPCLAMSTLGFRLVASGLCSSEGVKGAKGVMGSVADAAFGFTL